MLSCSDSMSDYYLLYKPFGTLSQFTPDHPGQPTLGELYNFPDSVYPVGRLDKDSEGLLLLTDDKALHTRLLNPKWKHPRCYLAQVEGLPEERDVEKLRKGVQIKIRGKMYNSLPANVEIIPPPSHIPPRDPPIRFRKSVPESWLRICLIEGKNRQVRKMCAAAGFPVLRLIRESIESLRLEDLGGRTVIKLDRAFVYNKLNIH